MNTDDPLDRAVSALADSRQDTLRAYVHALKLCVSLHRAYALIHLLLASLGFSIVVLNTVDNHPTLLTQCCNVVSWLVFGINLLMVWRRMRDARQASGYVATGNNWKLLRRTLSAWTNNEPTGAGGMACIRHVVWLPNPLRQGQKRCAGCLRSSCAT